MPYLSPSEEVLKKFGFEPFGGIKGFFKTDIRPNMFVLIFCLGEVSVYEEVDDDSFEFGDDKNQLFRVNGLVIHNDDELESIIKLALN
jgi:hypothetical protein